ncbi:YheC/YheD family protein [Neobacillus mesonae]|nr:YheC/YheD family protein [Neobacillus mesonae]
MNYNSRTVKSKWTKTQWLMDSRVIRNYIPETSKFSRNNLSSMLSQYKTVYFKPEKGSGGHNVVKIKRLRSGYLYQYESNQKRCVSLETLYAELKKRSKGKSFILQKGIQLEKTNDRPFDIRVMVQKSRSGVWRTTGVFTKIGLPDNVATNYHQGGTIELFRETLLGAGYNSSVIQKIKTNLKKLGEAVGKVFDKQLDGFQELGLDVALDRSGELWILEVNTRPQIYPLKLMKDQRLYRKILSRAQLYGRQH